MTVWVLIYGGVGPVRSDRVFASEAAVRKVGQKEAEERLAEGQHLHEHRQGSKISWRGRTWPSDPPSVGNLLMVAFEREVEGGVVDALAELVCATCGGDGLKKGPRGGYSLENGTPLPVPCPDC